MAQIVGQPEEKPQLLETEIGPRKMSAPLPTIRRFDESLKHVERRALDPVAEKKLLTARETLHGRHKPKHEAIMRFESRTGRTRTRTAGRRRAAPRRTDAAVHRAPPRKRG